LPKLTPVSGHDVCRILEQNDFTMVRQRGSHCVMQKCEDNTTVTVPVPLHKELCRGTLSSIIRQAGLSRSDFM